MIRIILAIVLAVCICGLIITAYRIYHIPASKNEENGPGDKE